MVGDRDLEDIAAVEVWELFAYKVSAIIRNWCTRDAKILIIQIGVRVGIAADIQLASVRR